MSKLTDSPVYSAKTKRRVKRGILGSGLIVLLVMAALFMRPSVLNPMPGKISVTLEAQVYRDGLLVEERVNDDDLLLNNFIDVIQALLYWPDDTKFIVELINTAEVTEDYTFWNTTTENTVADTDDDSIECSGWYGNSDDAPVRTDFGLKGGDVQAETLTSFSDDTDSFTLTFVATSDSGFTWKESGLSMKWYGEVDYTYIMLCRDTFSGMAVLLGDTLVINYRFNFATGYTTNFITLLLYLLMGSIQNGTVNVNLTDTGGTLRTINIYTPSGTTEIWFGGIGDTFFGGWLIISDSSSGIPSRSAYRLLGSSVTTQATVTVTGAAAYDVEAEATFIPGSGLTVVAAALYRYTAHSAGDAYFMMFALSHGGVYVAASTPVKATFTVGL